MQPMLLNACTFAGLRTASGIRDGSRLRKPSDLAEDSWGACCGTARRADR
jgi:hypothetical protein